MHYLCCGMLRSGSTWQYNVVRGLLEPRGLAAGAGFVARNEKLAGLLQEPAPCIVKVHEAFPAALSALRGGTAHGIYSHRDLRDVAASLMVRNRKRLDWVLDNGFLMSARQAYLAYSKAPRVLVQAYDIIVNEPGRALSEIAAFLNVQPDAAEKDRLLEELSLESQKRKVARMAGSGPGQKVLRRVRRGVGGLLHRTIGKSRTRKLTPWFGRIGVERVDRKSLLHSEHIHTGAIGSFRQVLTPAEIEKIEGYIRDSVMTLKA